MRHILDYIKKNKLLLFIIICGFFFHMLIIVPSGTYWCFGKSCGIQFWGAHDHDTIWHLALSAVAFQHWPFISPIFSGAALTGYNYLLDLVAHWLSIIGVPLTWIYFKIIPPIWFILLTYLLIHVGRKIKDEPVFIATLLFFSYFGGSFGFLFTLFHKGTIAGSSGMLAMQSLLTLTNLQFAISLLFILGLIHVIKLKRSLKKSIYIGSIIFCLFGLKFYAGIVGLFFIGSYDLISLIKEARKIIHIIISYIYQYLIIGIFVILAVMLFYNPFTSLHTGFPLIFSPFSIVHAMIEEPSLFYLKNMTNARYFLYSKGFGLRLLGIELFSTGLFIFFNLGARFFGILYFFYKLIKKKASQLDVAIFFTICWSFLLSTLFIQKGEWWNIIQFTYFGLFLTNLFIAELIYELFRKKHIVGIVIIFILIAVNIPENIDVLHGFNFFKPSSYISKQELESLFFLKKQPEGVVYVSSYDQDIQKKLSGQFNPPYPLYSIVDSAYVSAFSQKPLYFADVHVLRITGVDYENRYLRIKNNDCGIFNNVQYIYEVKNYPDPLLIHCEKTIQNEFKIINRNTEVIIFKSQ